MFLAFWEHTFSPWDADNKKVKVNKALSDNTNCYENTKIHNTGECLEVSSDKIAVF
jgi:hypothetical protein